MTSQLQAATPKRRPFLSGRAGFRLGSRKQRRDNFFAIRMGFFGLRPLSQALAIEFGNRKTRRYGPIQKTFRANQAQLVRQSGDALAREVDRIARELDQKLRSARRVS